MWKLYKKAAPWKGRSSSAYPRRCLWNRRAKFSKLENGLKSASVGKQGFTAQFVLFVRAGVRFDSSATSGVSAMVAIMGYKPAAHTRHFLAVKTLGQLCAHATATCKAGRQELVY